MAGNISGAFRLWLLAGSAVLPVAVGVAVNQILNDGKWNWWWILAALVISAALTWVTHLLTRAASTSATGESDEKSAGERSVTVGGDNSGIVSTGDNARNVQKNAKASGSGRVYQADGDQTINE
ncbi:hypothetical protein [Herbidospora sp. NBRC 101105]|uniref:hypothetical protein n=1 Tax=Herbidospora sp. NBRC 101105 TaxID=3032195 RepID=UPI0024A43356|nr:hypothetical protein [Herbidospora sp. NBRC 101105]GLX92947.1 hypothetical protein Hesp01_08970 [Herbidospora sp. NBRC 101105]